VLGNGRFLDLSHLLRSFFTAHTLKLFKFSVFGDLALFFFFRSLFLFSRSITYGTWLVDGMGHGRCLIEKYSRSLERDDMWRSFHAFSANHVYEKMKVRQQLSSSYTICFVLTGRRMFFESVGHVLIYWNRKTKTRQMGEPAPLSTLGKMKVSPLL
jgi:hypothetical protein